jgi:hypothetical protein
MVHHSLAKQLAALSAWLNVDRWPGSLRRPLPSSLKPSSLVGLERCPFLGPAHASGIADGRSAGQGRPLGRERAHAQSRADRPRRSSMASMGSTHPLPGVSTAAPFRHDPGRGLVHSPPKFLISILSSKIQMPQAIEIAHFRPNHRNRCGAYRNRCGQLSQPIWGPIATNLGGPKKFIITATVDTGCGYVHRCGVSLTIAQKNTLDGFVKPGELVNIREGAGLSLHDGRVFNLLIEHAWPEIGEDKQHSIPIAKLRGTRHKGRRIVSDSVTALMSTIVAVPTTLNGEPAVFKTQLLGPTTQVIDEDSPSAVLLYEFPKGLREIMQQSNYWGRIKAHVMFAFTSKFALALYEAVCLRANLRVNEQTFSVEDFRALLGVEPGKMPLFNNLKQKALDPALLEVNGLSDFNVEIYPIRQGGMVRGKLIGFRLWWEKKEPEDWNATLDELMRHRTGRRARIRGTVERVA